MSLGKRKSKIPLKSYLHYSSANIFCSGGHRASQLCLDLVTEPQLACLPGVTAALGSLIIRLSAEKIFSAGGHQTEIRLEGKG